MPGPDRYGNFAELERAEPDGAYQIRRRLRRSKVVVIAPHGGRIEPGTSDIGARIAADNYNLYRFEGNKRRGRNKTLHVTSHHFDEPKALALVAKCSIVLSIHGCEGIRTIYVGGRDRQLREDLAAALAVTGIRVKAYGHRYSAMQALNICNLGDRRRGAQLEITRDLRRSRQWRKRIAAIARDVIDQHVARLEVKQPPSQMHNPAERGRVFQRVQL